FFAWRRGRLPDLPAMAVVALVSALFVGLGVGSFLLPRATGPWAMVQELATHWLVVAGVATVFVGVLLLPVRVAVVGFFTLASIVGAMLLMPPATYLPKGNRNLVFGMMLTPPAYNIAQNETIGDRVEARLRPYWDAQSWEDTRKLPKVVMDPRTGQEAFVPP